jgi:hypothetical protein
MPHGLSDRAHPRLYLFDLTQWPLYRRFRNNSGHATYVAPVMLVRILLEQGCQCSTCRRQVDNDLVAGQMHFLMR